jgi:filamentous hemagglutinin
VAADGQKQLIVSNAIHPFFVQYLPENLEGAPPKSSEGHDYRGAIVNAQWIDAENLKVGYRLLGSSGGWLQVEEVRRVTEPLEAYNLSVADFHTYFIKGEAGREGVWVHNACAYTAEELPNAQPTGTKNSNGREEYTALGSDKKQINLYKGEDGKYYDSLQTYDGKMLGVDGTQIRNSKSTWTGIDGTSRVDVENPNPGQRAGQIHYQDKDNNKYYYDVNKKAFFVENSTELAPKKVQVLLENPNVARGIKKALSVLGIN